MNEKEHSVIVYVRHADRSVRCTVTHGASLGEVLGQVGYPGGSSAWRFVGENDQVVPMDCAVNGDMELELVHMFSGLGRAPSLVCDVEVSA